MRRGRKPRPDRASLKDTPLAALPRCPAHLSKTAQREWRRLASPLFEAGVLTLADRAALAAYCQAYGRWVEAEEKLRQTPPLLKTPSGYVQQSPWLTIANKQLDLMGRSMSELGLTPTSRARLDLPEAAGRNAVTVVEIVAACMPDTQQHDAPPVIEGTAEAVAEEAVPETAQEADPGPKASPKASPA